MENVIKLVHSKEGEIESYIESYLKYVGNESANTIRTYRSQISQFFKDTRGKNISDLTIKDLDFTFKEMTDYYSEICDKLKTKTINTRINAIKGLFAYLKKNKFEVDLELFDLKLKSNNYDSEGYEVLSYGEALKIQDTVWTQRNGTEKSLFIELAVVTSFRLDSLLTLTWNDFKQTENGTHYIQVLGKGNVWDKKPIRKDLYDRLVDFHNNLPISKHGELVFPSMKNAVNVKRMMDKALEELGWSHRNITFHSFKKAGVEAVKVITNGDIKAMQRQANHKDASTTMNNYQKANEDLDTMPSLLIGEDIDFSPLEELSEGELLKLINKAGFDFKMKLLTILKEAK